ncbi:membrane assembly protein AsmA [Halomonas aestuarii]|uniref:Membrane assembly protein AsmA n=1 Tax=Halomonas aestuarii TaxID=1897729 RepID=A0A1J0VEX2_9GAMM|nr:AsmA family protein [Halomonas aestuarii]APE30587.1 membrane assembly protein AsmA [Halomonas aestuarii]
MKRLLRTLLAAIGVLGLVMVGAVVYVTTFFDPNDLKPRLIEVVREHSGLELSLDGTLSWSFYPRLGVGVQEAEARLPDQADDETPFAAFSHAEVSLAFTPLLRGEIAIDGLTLDDLYLDLERDAQGEGNWEALLERLGERGEQAEAALAPASAGPDPDFGNGLSVALNIASVKVRGGEVRYRDALADRDLLVEDLEINGSNVNPGSAFPLESAFRLTLHEGLDWQEENREPRLVSDITLETRVDLGLSEGRHVLEGLNLKTVNRLAALENEQKLNLQGGPLVVNVGEGSLQLEEGKLDASLSHPSLGEKVMPLSLAFKLDADLNEQSARLRELELTGPDALKLNGNLNLSHLGEAPAYTGQLRLTPLSLRPWLTRLGMMPPMADGQALTDVALTSPVSGDLERFEFAGLTLVLDDATFTGRLAGRFDGGLIAADLQGDRLDLDGYLPPPGAGEASASRWQLPGIRRAHAEDAAGLVPTEWLSTLELDAHLALGQLRLAGLDFQDVDMTLKGSDGRHRLIGFESGFYEGTLAADGALDLRETPARWQLAPKAQRVRLESLLESLGEEPAPLSGRFSGEGELASRGNTLMELRRHLGGRLTTRIDEGAIPEINVSRELCTTAATLQGETLDREWADETRFERIRATLMLEEGEVQSDDLLVTLPGMEVGGKGSLDLVSEQFDLRAAVRLVSAENAPCEVNPRLAKVPLPVRCQGALGGVSAEWCRFDREAFQGTLAGLLRDEASQKAGEEVEKRLEGAVKKLDERLGEKAGGELRDALKGLFN